MLNLLRSFIAWSTRLITGVHLQQELKKTTHTPTIYFANHSSHLDFLVIWAVLPTNIREHVRPVAAADYWEKTSARRWIAKQIFRAITIDRKLHRSGSSIHPLQEPIDALHAGHSIIIFPEGTRSLDGKLHRFKPGLHYISTQAPNAPLAPIALSNLSRILPKGERFPIPILGRITFLPETSILENEDRKTFLDRTRQLVQDALPEPIKE